ncbi:MAG: alpha/beta hydrolase [Myxococcaceae bacterium]
MRQLTILLLILTSCAQERPERRAPQEPAASVQHGPLVRAGTSPLLHPIRVPVADNPGPHEDIVINTDDQLKLRGWIWKAPPGQERGWVVYVHDINRNRNEGIPAASALVSLGYDVLAYDQRAHGASEGAISTWGQKEFDDLHEALEQYTRGQVFLVGEGMGVMPVLREAKVHKRVKGVVLVAPYAEMQTAISGHQEEVQNFEQQSGVRVSELSPEAAARNIFIPVLILRGKADAPSAISDSERVHKAFHKGADVKELDGESGSLLGETDTWSVIGSWIQGHTI